MEVYNFSTYSDEDLLKAEAIFREIWNEKVMKMIFDESLDLVAEKLEKIEKEKKRREIE